LENEQADRLLAGALAEQDVGLWREARDGWSKGIGCRQAVLWVDAEAALQLLQQAEACRRCGDGAAAERLLEEVVRCWQRGTFLEGEEGDWVLARRAEVGRLSVIRFSVVPPQRPPATSGEEDAQQQCARS
jgi:hypothetical protein